MKKIIIGLIIFLLLPLAYAKPDLTLKKIQGLKDEIKVGDVLQPIFVFKNKGNTIINHDICTPTYENDIKRINNDVKNRWKIEPDTEYKLGIPFGPYSDPGKMKIEIKLDYSENDSCNNLLDEENEDNNLISFEFYVKELRSNDCQRTPYYGGDYDKHIVKKGDIIKEDYCKGTKTVVQYSCSGNTIVDSETKCQYACQDGACLLSHQLNQDFFINNPFYPTSSDGHNFDITIKLEEGWNLVFLNWASSLKKNGEIQTEDILVEYYLDPFTKKYVKLHPADEKTISKELSHLFADENIFYFASGAVWMYSKKSGYATFNRADTAKLNQIKLKKGWNMVGILPSMTSNKGINLDKIKGSCSISKAFIYDAINQSWVDVIDKKLIQKDQGGGMIVNVVRDCQLRDVAPSPPAIPP